MASIRYYDRRQPFPFMKLPPELRAMVYVAALQAYVDIIDSFTHKKIPTQAILNLLKIRKLRFECSAAVRHLARAHSLRHGSLQLDYVYNPRARAVDITMYVRIHYRRTLMHKLSRAINVVYEKAERKRHDYLKTIGCQPVERGRQLSLLDFMVPGVRK